MVRNVSFSLLSEFSMFFCRSPRDLGPEVQVVFDPEKILGQTLCAVEVRKVYVINDLLCHQSVTFINVIR